MPDLPDPVNGPGWYASRNRPGARMYWNGTQWGGWNFYESMPEREPLPPDPFTTRGTTVDGVGIGSTQPERIAYYAAMHRRQVDERELLALDEEPHAMAVPRVRGRMIDWWKPEIEHLKRTGQLALALELAWECMEAAEERTVRDDTDLDSSWAWEAAVIARKMRSFELEAQIIERVLDVDIFNDLVRVKWKARLVKAQQLATK